MAIFAADVVGYSRMMSDDEDGALASVRLLHTEVLSPRIASGGGRTIKLMSCQGFDPAKSSIGKAS